MKIVKNESPGAGAVRADGAQNSGTGPGYGRAAIKNRKKISEKCPVKYKIP